MNGGLKLYVSFTNLEKEGFLMPGYRHLDIKSEDLRSVLAPLMSVGIEQLLPADPAAGCDGTKFSFTLRRAFSSVSFHWWEGGPPEWSTLTQPVRELAPQLRQLSNSALQLTPASGRR